MGYPLSTRLRGVFEDVLRFPWTGYLVWREFGLAATALYTQAVLLRRIFFPADVPPFGRIVHRREMINLADNFAHGELRWPRMETVLAQTPAPVIVDVGVNVGLTVRWWFGLNPNAKVVGVDMIREALDWTTSRLPERDRSRWTPIEAVVGAKAGELEISFDDPLDGFNSVAVRGGTQMRCVNVRPLDELLPSIPGIALLKVDIEGAGGDCLAGAAQMLARTRFAVVETHDEHETIEAQRHISSRGFTLCKSQGRTLFFENQNLQKS